MILIKIQQTIAEVGTKRLPIVNADSVFQQQMTRWGLTAQEAQYFCCIVPYSISWHFFMKRLLSFSSSCALASTL